MSRCFLCNFLLEFDKNDRHPSKYIICSVCYFTLLVLVTILYIILHYTIQYCKSPVCVSAEACSGSAAAVDPDEDEDLVMIPSPMSGPVVRYPSCTSLNSTEPDDLDPSGADPDLDVADDEKDCDGDDDDGEGFLRLDAVSLEESWFVTPPACFTRSQPLPLEPSPLENLLIEHPSMSVYLLPSNGSSKPRPHLQRLTGNGGKPTPTAAKKEKRRSMEARHR